MGVEVFVDFAEEGADAAVDVGLPPEHGPDEAAGFEGFEEVDGSAAVFIGFFVDELCNWS